MVRPAFKVATLCQAVSLKKATQGPIPFLGKSMRQYLNAMTQFGLGEVRENTKSCNPESHEL